MLATLVALGDGLSLRQGRFLVLISVTGFIGHLATRRLEVLGKPKNEMALLVNEPRTFRLVV
jgi:hypothetical protein